VERKPSIKLSGVDEECIKARSESETGGGPVIQTKAELVQLDAATSDSNFAATIKAAISIVYADSYWNARLFEATSIIDIKAGDSADINKGDAGYYCAYSAEIRSSSRSNAGHS
jgi:hypothetical protein